MSKVNLKKLNKAKSKLRDLAIITNLGFGEMYMRLEDNIELIPYGYMIKVVCPKTGSRYCIRNVRNKTIFIVDITTDYVNGVGVTEEIQRLVITHKTKNTQMEVHHNRYIHIGKIILGVVNGDAGNYTVDFDDSIVNLMIEHNLPHNPLEWTEEHINKLK